MAGISKTIFGMGNLYFILIMCGTIFVVYLLSIVLNSINLYVAENKPGATQVINSLSGPILMFIINAGYGIGQHFINLPLSLAVHLEHVATILLLINAGWLLFNIITASLQTFSKAVDVKILTIIKVSLLTLLGGLVLALYYREYIAIIISTALAVIFMSITQRLISAPKPLLKEKLVLPKKIVMMHIYISTNESHAALKKAISLIKQLIKETEGTEENPQVLLSAFTPNAFDISVSYTITDAGRINEIKEDINIKIIKTLNDENIKFSGNIAF